MGPLKPSRNHVGAFSGPPGPFSAVSEGFQEGSKMGRQPVTNKAFVRDRLLGPLEALLGPIRRLLGVYHRSPERSQRASRGLHEGPTTCHVQGFCFGDRLLGPLETLLGPSWAPRAGASPLAEPLGPPTSPPEHIRTLVESADRGVGRHVLAPGTGPRNNPSEKANEK